MMPSRVRLLPLGLAVLCAATPVRAQATRFDTSQVRSFTVAALVQAARLGDSLANFRTSAPATHAAFARTIQQLDRPDVGALALVTVARPGLLTGDVRRAGFRFIAGTKREKHVPGLQPGDGPALDTLAMLMGQELGRALDPVLGEDSTDRILTPLDAFNYARRDSSIAESLEKLRRYEHKFGPGAPRLNALEVVLNYGAQWVPGFRPNPEGWPASLELVASYVPSYATMVDGEARPMTAAELGIRHYIFAKGFGGSILKPGYLSFGVAMAGARDGALTSPLQGESRVGGFFGWGEAKIAWVGGKNKRVLITRQVQLLPWVF